MRVWNLLSGILLYPLLCSGKYIVKLKPGTIITQDPRYESINIGDFNALIIEDDDVLEDIKSQGIVEFYEEDLSVSIDVYQWGIDRIDQVDLPLDRKYKSPSHGKDMYVYVLDTGVHKSHKEFEGRVDYGLSLYGSDSRDNHGHGTHVMSTVLGKTVGVANSANGIGVKVLSDGGSGSISGVVKGIEWSVNDIINKDRCGVISMSLGGGKSDSLNNAVNAAVNTGINVVVAGGNSNADACKYSPASATGAITVGSTTKFDSRSSFSNYGDCTDIFAPGSSIVGASQTSNNGYRTLSGTSMACPHVSGATLLMLENNQCIQKNLKKEVIKLGVDNTITNIPRGTSNIFLQVQNIASAPTPPTPSPVLDCVKECNSVKNRCNCWYNHAILDNDQYCKCQWKRKKKKNKCVPRSSTYKENLFIPKPFYSSCDEECGDTSGKCACLTNKKRGGNCDCRWSKRKKCLSNN